MFRGSARVLRTLGKRQYGYAHVPKPRKPHLLGPSSVWRKCNVVFPINVTLDPLTKYQRLTKSSVIQGLPERITACSVEESDIDEIKKRVSQILAIQAPKQLKPDEECVSLLMNMLAPMWKHCDNREHLLRSSLALRPNIESYWRCDSVNYICKPTPVYIFHTDKALELFVDPKYKGNKSLPNQSFTPRHMNLFLHPFNQITVFAGFTRRSNFPYAHTLLVYDPTSRSPDQLSSHALIQLFSQAAAQTLQSGYKLDTELYYPLATQAIVTNGQSFAFFCYQLNSLDMRSSTGVQNLLYIGPVMKLFEKYDQEKGAKKFNRECAKLFFQFMLQQPTRDGPEFSGFQLTEKAKREWIATREDARKKYRLEREIYWKEKTQQLHM